MRWLGKSIDRSKQCNTADPRCLTHADAVHSAYLFYLCPAAALLLLVLQWCEDKGSFYMVIEVCTGGELMDRIVKEQHFSEKIASRYFKQVCGRRYGLWCWRTMVREQNSDGAVPSRRLTALIRSSHHLSVSHPIQSNPCPQMCEGLAHIHSKLVVHRDLKPENFLMECEFNCAEMRLVLLMLLVTSLAAGMHHRQHHLIATIIIAITPPAATSPDACIKISDFGLSCAIASPDGVITDACGSAYYIAPEVRENVTHHEHSSCAVGTGHC